MPDYIVILLRHSAADGLFHVDEVKVTDADDEADALDSAIEHAMKPGDKLEESAVKPAPTTH